MSARGLPIRGDLARELGRREVHPEETLPLQQQQAFEALRCSYDAEQRVGRVQELARAFSQQVAMARGLLPTDAAAVVRGGPPHALSSSDIEAGYLLARQALSRLQHACGAAAHTREASVAAATAATSGEAAGAAKVDKASKGGKGGAAKGKEPEAAPESEADRVLQEFREAMAEGELWKSWLGRAESLRRVERDAHQERHHMIECASKLQVQARATLSSFRHELIGLHSVLSEQAYRRDEERAARRAEATLRARQGAHGRRKHSIFKVETSVRLNFAGTFPDVQPTERVSPGEPLATVSLGSKGRAAAKVMFSEVIAAPSHRPTLPSLFDGRADPAAMPRPATTHAESGSSRLSVLKRAETAAGTARRRGAPLSLAPRPGEIVRGTLASRRGLV